MKENTLILKICLLIVFSVVSHQLISATLSKEETKDLIDSALISRHKNHELSISLATKALAIAIDSGYSHLEIDARNCLGLILYFYTEQYDSACQHLYKAYELSQKSNYETGICEYLTLKGFISEYSGNMTRAKTYFLESLDLAKQINNKKLLGRSQYGLSLIYLNKEEYELAMELVDKAISNYQAVLDKYSVAQANGTKSVILFSQGDHTAAVTQLEKTRSIFLELDDQKKIMTCDYTRASFYKEMKVYDKALPIFHQCADNITNLHTEIPFLSIKMLSDIYGELEQFEKAFKYQIEFQKYLDSAYSVERFNEINNLQSDYESKIKENENLSLQQENKIKSLQVKKNKIAAWLSAFILVQAIIFLIILYRKYRLNQRTSVELRKQQQLIHEQEKEIKRRENLKIKENLEYNKRELAFKVFQTFQGNMLTQDVLKNLKSLKYKIKTRGRAGDEIRTDIQNMINKISFNSNAQIWDEFEMYFNKVTPGFKKWLTTTYPYLTANEIRLCIFSQLNLKTKEISNITLQSVQSINIARTRLRKKIGLEDPNRSISSYLIHLFMQHSNEVSQPQAIEEES